MTIVGNNLSEVARLTEEVVSTVRMSQSTPPKTLALAKSVSATLQAAVKKPETFTDTAWCDTLASLRCMKHLPSISEDLREKWWMQILCHEIYSISQFLAVVIQSKSKHHEMEEETDSEDSFNAWGVISETIELRAETLLSEVMREFRNHPAEALEMVELIDSSIMPVLNELTSSATTPA